MLQRKWIIGAAVLAAVVLVAGALLTRGSDAGSGSGATGRTTDEASVDLTPAAGEGSSAATGAGTTGGEGTIGSVPATAVPGSDTRYGGTAADRTELATVTAAPPGTLAVITGDEAQDGDRFRVVFRPYGWGPARPGGRSLVIRVDSASRSPQNASDLELEPGQNALVVVPEAVSHSIGDGGSYTGMIVLRAGSGALSLHLEQAAGAAP